jgi:predicted XRE-type DNA-binding protein
MAKNEAVTYSTESAFHALGLPDADDLVLRAELMRKIGDIIAARGLTQVQAGELMRMDQPRVSALLTGKIAKFSTDRLLRRSVTSDRMSSCGLRRHGDRRGGCTSRREIHRRHRRPTVTSPRRYPTSRSSNRTSPRLLRADLEFLWSR